MKTKAVHENHKNVIVSSVTFEIPKKTNDRAWKKMAKWSTHKQTRDYYVGWYRHGGYREGYELREDHNPRPNHKQRQPRNIIDSRLYSNGVPRKSELRIFVDSAVTAPYTYFTD